MELSFGIAWGTVFLIGGFMGISGRSDGLQIMGTSGGAWGLVLIGIGVYCVVETIAK